MKKPIRVRFAPAPTGLMHIGNVRTALLNYLFACQHEGEFILRIEDTDAQRNFDPSAQHITADLAWLGLSYDEGPSIGGPYAPYFQSERAGLYQEKLQKLIDAHKLYRCFCTQETLEKKRTRQQALKLPPRYDRACMRLSQDEITQHLAANTPFVWRFALEHSKSICITDLARGQICFDLKNFSDFPVTRADGSFTFLFANAIDDMNMNITHVFRGEDHLSNTAAQAALYQAFQIPLPTFWHMPILCNVDGKKLSKRDFGFSLQDLRTAGYLPEAIDNYLAIIGGSFADEIMSLDELARTFDFTHVSKAAQIKYDVDKLQWVNRQWIERYNADKLTQAVVPFLEKRFPQVRNMDQKALAQLLQIAKSEFATLADVPDCLAFYFQAPELSAGQLHACITPNNRETVKTIVLGHLNLLADPDAFAQSVKKAAQENAVPIKEFFWFLRLSLMGSTKGFGIGELLQMLGPDESQRRIARAVELLG